MIEWHIIASLLPLLGLLTLISNTVVIIFYFKSRRETIPMTYIVLAACDAMTGLVTFVHCYILAKTNFGSFDFTNEEVYLSRDMTWVVGMCSVMTTATTRCSLLYNIILVVTRTINITQPFAPVKKRYIIASVCIYPALWITLNAWDFGLYMMEPILPKRTFNFLTYYMFVPCPFYNIAGLAAETSKDLVNILLLFCIFTTMALPAIIIFICSLIQAFYLLKCSHGAATNNAIIRENTQRNMTKTILILTILCFVCNLPYTWSTSHAVIKSVPPSMDMFFYSYFMSTLLPFINSALNPVVMMLRGAALRQFFWERVGRIIPMWRGNVFRRVARYSVSSIRSIYYQTQVIEGL